MRTFCVVGESNTGKTVLIEKLVKTLTSKGYTVCTLKHTNLNSFDTEGKDTSKHLKAGALMTFGLSKKECIAFLERDTIDDISKLLPPCDFFIIEGGKNIVCPKILVGKKKIIKERYVANWQMGQPVEKVIQSIMTLPSDSIQLYVDGKRINLKPFIQKAIISMLLGFIVSLKGVESTDHDLAIKVNLKEFKNQLKED
jgi:molybdopterin-guanine dinucleotide biosynthesis protein B